MVQSWKHRNQILSSLKNRIQDQKGAEERNIDIKLPWLQWEWSSTDGSSFVFQWGSLRADEREDCNRFLINSFNASVFNSGNRPLFIHRVPDENRADTHSFKLWNITHGVENIFKCFKIIVSRSATLESQSQATVLEDAIPTCIYYVSNPVLHASLSQDAPLRSVGVQSQTAWWQGRKLWSSGGEYCQSTKGLTPLSPSLTKSFSNSLSSISTGHVNYF